MTKTTPKHVIFLGAGASYTSGYPLAEQLRKEWLISQVDLRGKPQPRMRTLARSQ